jgi:integrase
VNTMLMPVKGLQIFTDRHGKRRCYHRPTKTAIDLQKFPEGSAEFAAEVARIGATINRDVALKPGTLGTLVAAYKAHSSFLDLAPRTKRDYGKVFDYLATISDTALVKFDKPLVVRIRDKSAASKGRRFANYTKAVLSIIFAWGSERGYLASNPAAGIKGVRRPKNMADANRPWSDEERDAVLAAIPAHMRPALALMMFCGLGPKDALTMPRTFYKDGEIGTRRSKTGEAVFWPAPAPLIAILNAAPRHDAITLCANSRGKPWSVDGYSTSWYTTRAKLEKAGAVGSNLTLYGLRHTVAVILREIGYDERTIADALGQKTTEMARHYAKGADLKPKMRGVVKSFEDELHKRRTGIVKL